MAERTSRLAPCKAKFDLLYCTTRSSIESFDETLFPIRKAMAEAVCPKTGCPVKCEVIATKIDQKLINADNVIYTRITTQGDCLETNQ